MRSPIRVATPADAGRIHEIYSPVVRDSPVSFETEPPSVSEIADRIARTLPRHPWIVFEDCEVIVGYAYASDHRWRAAYQWAVETTVYVDTARHRSGIGRALYASLFHVLGSQGYCQALAGITVPNPQSVGFHESLGFVQVALYPRIGFKSGAWRDVGWWSRPLAEQTLSPAPPVPFSAL